MVGLDSKHNTSREAAKISTFSSSKIDKYKYLMCEQILSFDQSRMIEQAYSPVGKTFEK